MSSRLDPLNARLARVRWLTVPLGAYVVITLLLPIANGAASRNDFAHHAMWVLGSCTAVLGICMAVGALADLVRSTVWRNR
jgi:hypothetical protein